VIRRKWPVIRKARASYWEIPNNSQADTAPFVIAAPCAGAAKRRLGLVVICENVNVRSSYVCGQVHCVGAQRLHDALRPHARPSRDGAQPNGDDGPRRDDDALSLSRPPGEAGPFRSRIEIQLGEAADIEHHGVDQGGRVFEYLAGHALPNR
jgi:hypothetical protein